MGIIRSTGVGPLGHSGYSGYSGNLAAFLSLANTFTQEQTMPSIKLGTEAIRFATQSGVTNLATMGNAVIAPRIGNTTDFVGLADIAAANYILAPGGTIDGNSGNLIDLQTLSTHQLTWTGGHGCETLFVDNTLTFRTTDNGDPLSYTFDGPVTATAFIGDGSGLTGLESFSGTSGYSGDGCANIYTFTLDPNGNALIPASSIPGPLTRQSDLTWNGTVAGGGTTTLISDGSHWILTVDTGDIIEQWQAPNTQCPSTNASDWSLLSSSFIGHSDAIIGVTNSYTGSSGTSGSSGRSGFSGYSGVSGSSGRSGYSGYSGVSGTSGYSGYSGVSGSSGSSGRSGTSGYSGYSGVSGTSGYSGYTGVSGSSGRSGYSGYSGVSGTSGYSAALTPPISISSSVDGSLFALNNTHAWSGSQYSLDVTGYTNMNGFRMNGADAGAAVYLSGAQMGFSVDNGQVMTVGVIGGGGVKFTVDANGVYTYAKPSEPSNFTGSTIVFYLDESGNNLKVSCRYSDGSTLKHGTIALS